MSFNNLQPSSGPYWLAPGQSMGLEVWFGDPGDDHGATWIMAHPLDELAATALQVSGFYKRRAYTIGVITENGSPQYGHAGDSYIRYGVTVTNIGTEAVHFSVQGGGNT